MKQNPVDDLTPAQIVQELDKYIVGQHAAKRAVAVALRNRYRRLQLPAADRGDVLPKNILMIGPTGVGKTEIARRLAQLSHAPLVKVEATKFTEVGYVGRDVESMVRDLAAAAVRLVEQERIEASRPQAEAMAVQNIADQILEKRRQDSFDSDNPDELAFSHQNHDRDQLIEELRAGQHREEIVEVEFEDSGSGFMQAFTPQGIEEINLDMFGPNNPFARTSRSYRQMRVQEALPFILEQEAKRLLDSGTITREAIKRAEESGIIFIDEIDKVAIKSSGGGPDVSREGVQRDLLPIIEGSTVATKFGPIQTDHILFIAAGAFHMAKPSDLIPELQGRLPIRVELEALSEDDFRRILLEPKNALTKQYQQLLAVDNVNLAFTEEAIDEIARFAREVNQRTENIGARRLHTCLERLLETLLFEAPFDEPRTVVFDGKSVEQKLKPLLEDLGRSERIL